MAEESYLRWLVGNTATTWWNDSGDPDEIRESLAQGATGVTTNPVLSYRTLAGRAKEWAPTLGGLIQSHTGEERAEALTRLVVTGAAQLLEPTFVGTGGKQGYVCGQVNPKRDWDREGMLAMARRYHAWAPNIAVKLPVTAAGLDVMEECAAEGITVTMTVSFTVPQVVAIGERFEKGRARAEQAGITPGRCFSVIMIGRLDDYLREVAQDMHANVSEADIRQSGLAATKRAYQIYQERGYQAVLLIAALRGTYHTTELAGADVIMSITPGNQEQLLAPGVVREQRIDKPIAPDVIARLQTIPDFVRAYEPDGMAPTEFVTYGATQRTLSQFTEMGWNMLESFKLG